mmetsp:Transcript_8468/g.38220  ORF Transcript_8468/g.38220 Transcript_8468/m.38220 type:complete len:225 (-) Transcript_8468:430-1104(-)
MPRRTARETRTPQSPSPTRPSRLTPPESPTHFPKVAPRDSDPKHRSHVKPACLPRCRQGARSASPPPPPPRAAKLGPLLCPRPPSCRRAPSLHPSRRRHPSAPGPARRRWEWASPPRASTPSPRSAQPRARRGRTSRDPPLREPPPPTFPPARAAPPRTRRSSPRTASQPPTASPAPPRSQPPSTASRSGRSPSAICVYRRRTDPWRSSRRAALSIRESCELRR